MTETNRIRWETGQFGNLVGYAGTVESWAFQVWHISDDEDSHWSLISSLPDVANWNATDPDSPEPLKAEAESWLERFVASRGAVFPPEPDESAAFQCREARSVLARWDASRNDPDGKVYDRERVLADQVRALIPIAETAVTAAEGKGDA
jgi:hypothetical protein